MCFDFLYNIFRNISYSKQKWILNDKKCESVFM